MDIPRRLSTVKAFDQGGGGLLIFGCNGGIIHMEAREGTIHGSLHAVIIPADMTKT